MTFVVAIDGPAGTGKSSAARFLARQLNYIYVDTGAIYRALAFLVEKYSKNPDDALQVVALIPRISVVIDQSTHSTKIVIDGITVDSELRCENISRLSSIVSQHTKVREELLTVQRNLVKGIGEGAIFEGRDIGTVVFPKAPLKIFITANSETRARRRYDELKKGVKETSYDDVLQGITKRDERDEKRQTAPMQKANDAYVIDTSTMTLEQVTKRALELIESTKAKKIKGSELW